MFVLDEFKELVDLAEMHEYASKNLNFLYELPHRMVYELDEDRVLKVANDDDGVSRNSDEFRISSSHNFENVFPQNIITKVYEKDSMSYWLISERCQFVSEEEFSKIVSMGFDKFSMFLRELTIIEESPPEKVQKTIEFLKGFGIIPGSLTDFESWGKVGQEIKLMSFGRCRKEFIKRQKKYKNENSKSVYSNYVF